MCIYIYTYIRWWMFHSETPKVHITCVFLLAAAAEEIQCFGIAFSKDLHRTEGPAGHSQRHRWRHWVTCLLPVFELRNICLQLVNSWTGWTILIPRNPPKLAELKGHRGCLIPNQSLLRFALGFDNDLMRQLPGQVQHWWSVLPPSSPNPFGCQPAPRTEELSLLLNHLSQCQQHGVSW